MSDLISARDICASLGYVDWRNFRGVIKRAENLIRNGKRIGFISETTKLTNIGSGAKREIADYLLDKDAFQVVVELASSYKLNRFFGVRNETAVLSLLEKYCALKGIYFQFQYHLDRYIFDGLVGDSVLIEFDEPHHKTAGKNIKMDRAKDDWVRTKGFTLLRFDLSKDIIDVIVEVERAFHNHD